MIQVIVCQLFYQPTWILSTQKSVRINLFISEIILLITLTNFKKRLSEVKWQEILDNNDANDDYNTIIEQFNKVYDECIPLKKCTINRKKTSYVTVDY